MNDNTLLLKLLNTELTALQKQRVEDHLFDLLVNEKLNDQLEYIKTVISDEIENLTFEQQIELLKTKLG